MTPVRRQWIPVVAVLLVLAVVVHSGCTAGTPASDRGNLSTVREDRVERGALDDTAERLVLPGEELWIIEAPAPIGSEAITGVDPADGTGSLRASATGAVAGGTLPIEETRVVGKISGFVASVHVIQRFVNPHSTRFSGAYSFPLPDAAAVHEFVVRIGERRIRAIVRERAEAQAIYREARNQGLVATLMTQRQSRTFLQEIANIAPRVPIEVHLRYHDRLAYAGGGFRLTYPIAPQTGENRLSITFEIDAGVPIESVSSNHAVEVTRPDDRRARITLDGKANRDFELRYDVAGKYIKNGLLTHEDARGRFFSIFLYPPRAAEAEGPEAVEMTFLIDTAPTMRGWPLLKAKRAVARALRKLQLGDRFNIVTGAPGESGMLDVAAVPASDAGVQRSVEFLQGVKAGDGALTEETVRRVLAAPRHIGQRRVVFLLSDGAAAGYDEWLVPAIRRSGARERVVAIGVGAVMNRRLLDAVATAGRGAVSYVGEGSSAGDIVDAFLSKFRYPLLTDITVTGTAAAGELYPASLPDLFMGRPLFVTGRIPGTEPAALTLSGWSRGRERRLDIRIPGGDDGHPGIAHLWARSKVAALERVAVVDTAAIEKMRDVALEYGLLSPATAFIAVDTSPTTGKEKR